jgi:hypothetical protein
MKLLFRALVLAGAFCILDLVALVLVTRAWLPGKPPNWATGPFFWVLAWPVPLFTRVFPQPAGSPDHGPSLLAVGSGALVDLVLLTLLALHLLRRRQAAPSPAA